MAEQRKRDPIFDFLINFNADMYLLQETHNDNHGHEQQWEKEWGGRCIWSRGMKSRGSRWYMRRGSDTHSMIRACPYSDHSVAEIDWTVIQLPTRH